MDGKSLITCSVLDSWREAKTHVRNVIDTVVFFICNIFSYKNPLIYVPVAQW